MKHEIIELHDVQIIGMAKKIAFNEAKEECPKFWGEYVEKIIKPVVFEKNAPNDFQKAAFANGVGEFGLCTCDIPNHNCATCAEMNFGVCSKHRNLLPNRQHNCGWECRRCKVRTHQPHCRWQPAERHQAPFFL